MAKKIVRKGKKGWVKIVGPKYFRSVEIGESYVYSSNDLIGKKLKINLSVLSGDMRKQHVNIGFKVVEASGSQAVADIYSYEIVGAHVRRMVRTLKDKVDDSFFAESKDKIKLRIKPVVITRAKVNHSVFTAIRKKIREDFIKNCMENDFNDIVNSVINGEYQGGIRKELNKVYPVSAFEIRKLEVVK